MLTLVKKTSMVLFFTLYGYQAYAQSLDLSLTTETTIQTGQTFDVKIRSLQNVPLDSFEIIFKFDESQIRFDSFKFLDNTSFCGGGISQRSDSLIIWYGCHPFPVTLTMDSTFLTFKFEVIGCAGSQANVELIEGAGYLGTSIYTVSPINVMPQIICRENISQKDTSICVGQEFLGVAIQKDTVLSEILSDSCACDSIIQYRVFGKSLPEGTITVDLVDCIDEIYSLEFVPDGIDGMVFQYNWSDGSSNPNNIVLDSGTMELIVTDEFSCQNTFYADWGGRSILDISIDTSRSGFAMLLTVNQVSAGPLQFLWNTGNKSNEIQVTESGTYSVIVQDSLGCIDSASIDINLDSEFNFFIPDAFSPNEDNTNDYWSVFFGQAIEGIENLEIFDRWGGKIYSRPIANREESLQLWDGISSSGIKVDLNIVVYSLTLKYFNGRKVRQSGTLHIIQ